MDNVMAPMAITRSADHRYTFCPVHIMDGACPLGCVTPRVTVPGVTGILDVLDKSAPLMTWAARQTAEAVYELGIGHVTTLDGIAHETEWDGMGVSKLIATVGKEGFVKSVTSRANWQRDEAANLGTEVHRLAEEFINGRTVSVAPRGEGIAKRVSNYATWWQSAGWKLRLSEAMIVNPEWGYGGTFDLLATDQDGRTVLADIKTGGRVNRKAYESEILQLAAYGAFASTYVQAPDGRAYPMPPVERFALLHLTLEGLRVMDIAIGARDMSAFCSCIDLHDWMNGKQL